MARDPIADVGRGWTLPATDVPIEFTDHAIEQANRRVFRRLDLELTKHNVSALIPAAVVTREPPRWRPRLGDFGRRAFAWQISTDPYIAFPLAKVRAGDKLLAISALTDGDDHPVGATVRGAELLAGLFPEERDNNCDGVVAPSSAAGLPPDPVTPGTSELRGAGPGPIFAGAAHRSLVASAMPLPPRRLTSPGRLGGVGGSA